jgi:hypothetical protein
VVHCGCCGVLSEDRRGVATLCGMVRTCRGLECVCCGEDEMELHIEGMKRRDEGEEL